MKLQRGMVIQIHNEEQYLRLMELYNKTFSDGKWPWPKDGWRNFLENYMRNNRNIAINIEAMDDPDIYGEVCYCRLDYYRSNKPYCDQPIIDFDELDHNLQIINPSDLESLLLT